MYIIVAKKLNILLPIKYTRPRLLNLQKLFKNVIKIIVENVRQIDGY